MSEGTGASPALVARLKTNLVLLMTLAICAQMLDLIDSLFPPGDPRRQKAQDLLGQSSNRWTGSTT